MLFFPIVWISLLQHYFKEVSSCISFWCTVRSQFSKRLKFADILFCFLWNSLQRCQQICRKQSTWRSKGIVLIIAKNECSFWNPRKNNPSVYLMQHLKLTLQILFLLLVLLFLSLSCQNHSTCRKGVEKFIPQITRRILKNSILVLKN